jgi:hypothetical protein
MLAVSAEGRSDSGKTGCAAAGSAQAASSAQARANRARRGAPHEVRAFELGDLSAEDTDGRFARRPSAHD